MPIVVDTFIGGDGTFLTAHVSDSGHSWASLEGPINTTILTNRARMSFAFGIRSYFRYSLAPVSPDYEVFVDILHESNTSEDSEVWARIPATTIGGYFVRVTGMAPGARVLLFRRSPAGVDTLLATLDTGVQIAGITQRVGIRVRDTLIQAIYNGIIVHSVVDATFTDAGHAGIGGKGAGAGAADVFIDNFSLDYSPVIQYVDPVIAAFDCPGEGPDAPLFSFVEQPSPREVDLDLFTDANGVLLENHVSSVGASWTKVAPASVILTIQANKLLQTLDIGVKTGTYRLNYAVPVADYTVSVTIRENAVAAHNSVVGVMGRLAAANQSGYAADLNLSNPATIRLVRCDAAGTPIVIAAAVPTVLDPRGTPIKVSLRLTGTLIEALINDVVVLSVVDAVIVAAGHTGLRYGNPTAGSTQAEVDSMHLSYLQAAVPIPQAVITCSA